MSDVSRHGFRHAGSVCRGCQSSLPKSLRIRSREITVLARAGPTVLARACAGVNRLKAGAKAWVPTSNALAANICSDVSVRYPCERAAAWTKSCADSCSHARKARVDAHMRPEYRGGSKNAIVKSRLALVVAKAVHTSKAMLSFAVLAVVSSGGLANFGTAAHPSVRGAGTARHSRLLPRMMAGDSYDTNEAVLAARKGKTEALSELLAADKAAANTAVKCAKIPTMDGATPIIWAARQVPLTLTLTLALTRCASWRQRTTPSPTPIPIPNQGKLEAVRLLLSNAADVNAAAQSGWTALYAAALNGHESIVELLVSNDASG